MKNKKLILAIGVLAVFTLILAYMNMRSIDTSAEGQGDINFIIKGTTVPLSFDEIVALSPVEFKATEDTSTSGPALRKYKGVLLKDVINKAVAGEAIEGASKVVIKGIDGYAVALAVDEVLSSDSKVYLAFEKDGKTLGNRKSGGSGPIQMIVTGDTFSQRWCKYVFEVSIE
jgi:hypothetical protein